MKRSKKTPSLVPEVKERSTSSPVLVVGGEGSKPPRPLKGHVAFRCPSCAGDGTTRSGSGKPCSLCKGKRLVKILVDRDELEEVYEVTT